MAEREGFEPSVEFPLHTLSKRARSTTPTSLRLESTSWSSPEQCSAKPPFTHIRFGIFSDINRLAARTRDRRDELCQTLQSSEITYGDLVELSNAGARPTCVLRATTAGVAVWTPRSECHIGGTQTSATSCHSVLLLQCDQSAGTSGTSRPFGLTPLTSNALSGTTTAVFSRKDTPIGPALHPIWRAAENVAVVSKVLTTLHE